MRVRQMVTKVEGRYVGFASSALVALILGGCAANPETATIVAQPSTAPVKNITSFSEALSCMDDLFVLNNKRNIVITSAGIPDATGKIATGTKEMMISAIADMSIKSKAFKFVDFDATQTDVHALQQLVGFTNDFVVPNYYIRGAITQLDENVIRDSKGGGISAPNVDLSVSKDQIGSVISLDLNVGKLVTREILPGMSSTNQIVVLRKGFAGDVGATIGKVGITFNISKDRAQGPSQAVRTLVELGVIETMGKLTQVPYWQCLSIDSTNPTAMTQARDWYDAMTPKDHVVIAQRGLKAAGYYNGEATGEVDSATRDAVSRYQADNALIATGRPDFQLYMKLLGAKLAVAGSNVPAAGPERAPITPLPLALDIKSDKGPSRTPFRVNDILNVDVQVSRNAYLYCYYQDATGAVVRVFPNQFQPNAYIAGGRVQQIPSPSSPFQLRLDKPGVTEQVACVASDREVGLQLPDNLKAEDLKPLPVRSVDDVISYFPTTTDRSGSAVARLLVPVTR